MKGNLKERGITLLALIITIILLLIITGVTLSGALRREWINKEIARSSR